ncbi:stage V sporulation protein SpoVM [Lysinibacillus agricola]|nr:MULTISPECIES: stage V sporulation protein SpoVM [Lysinibacillus]QQP14854.1 stage V sporulation protein SpoVM [Lysinibacillus agricola]
MKVYTFQLPKFVSSITRTCINIFKKEKKVKKSDKL